MQAAVVGQQLLVLHQVVEEVPEVQVLLLLVQQLAQQEMVE
jgi:hypothetical protein